MRRLVLGVIGHVDHGKTALVHALTGMDTDRLPEEKRRGISIALGFAHFRAGPETEIDLIDMPGHERFVRTMIGGSTGIDALLLVVAANEGIKPQTVEHVDIAALLGIRRAVIAVSKADLVAPDAAKRTGEAAALLLEAAGIASFAPVITAATRGDGIAALRDALLAVAVEPGAADGVLFLPIDRSFSVAGHGTVITGTLRGAKLAPGDELELLPAGERVRVRAVQVHGSRVATARPGQRVAVNLRDVETSRVPRGAALAQPGMLPSSEWLSVRLRAVADAPPLRTTKKLQLLLGTTELEARLRLLDRDVLEPGEVALAQLHCAAPVSIPAREHFVLRLPSPARTVAGGIILETETARQRRHAPDVLCRLSGLATMKPGEVLRQELASAEAIGRSLQRLSRLTSLAPAKVAELLQAFPVVIVRGQVAVTLEALAGLLERIPAVLAKGNELSREQLNSVLDRDRKGPLPPGEGWVRALVVDQPSPRPSPEGRARRNVSDEVLDEALKRLVASGAVRLQGGVYTVPRPEQDQARASLEARLAAQIVQALRRGGLSPPDARSPGKRVLDRLVQEGEVVRTHDRVQKRDVLFHREAIAEARRRLMPLLEQPPGLLVSEIGAALGISRKYSVPLLEHLDAIHFTRRVGDRRMLALIATPE